jgi:hypothetical protein
LVTSLQCYCAELVEERPLHPFRDAAVAFTLAKEEIGSLLGNQQDFDHASFVAMGFLQLCAASLPVELPTLLLWGCTRPQQRSWQTLQSFLHTTQLFLSSSIEQHFAEQLWRRWDCAEEVSCPAVGHTLRPALSYEHHRISCAEKVAYLLQSQEQSPQQGQRASALALLSSQEEFALLCRWSRSDAFALDAGFTRFLLSSAALGLEQVLGAANSASPQLAQALTSLELLHCLVSCSYLHCLDSLLVAAVQALWSKLYHALCRIDASPAVSALGEALLVKALSLFAHICRASARYADFLVMGKHSVCDVALCVFTHAQLRYRAMRMWTSRILRVCAKQGAAVARAVFFHRHHSSSSSSNSQSGLGSALLAMLEAHEVDGEALDEAQLLQGALICSIHRHFAQIDGGCCRPGGGLLANEQNMLEYLVRLLQQVHRMLQRCNFSALSTPALHLLASALALEGAKKQGEAATGDVWQLSLRQALLAVQSQQSPPLSAVLQECAKADPVSDQRWTAKGREYASIAGALATSALGWQPQLVFVCEQGFSQQCCNLEACDQLFAAMRVLSCLDSTSAGSKNVRQHLVAQQLVLNDPSLLRNSMRGGILQWEASRLLHLIVCLALSMSMERSSTAGARVLSFLGNIQLSCEELAHDLLSAVLDALLDSHGAASQMAVVKAAIMEGISTSNSSGRSRAGACLAGDWSYRHLCALAGDALLEWIQALLRMERSGLLSAVPVEAKLFFLLKLTCQEHLVQWEAATGDGTELADSFTQLIVRVLLSAYEHDPSGLFLRRLGQESGAPSTSVAKLGPGQATGRLELADLLGNLLGTSLNMQLHPEVTAVVLSLLTMPCVKASISSKVWKELAETRLVHLIELEHWSQHLLSAVIGSLLSSEDAGLLSVYRALRSLRSRDDQQLVSVRLQVLRLVLRIFSLANAGKPEAVIDGPVLLLPMLRDLSGDKTSNWLCWAVLYCASALHAEPVVNVTSIMQRVFPDLTAGGTHELESKRSFMLIEAADLWRMIKSSAIMELVIQGYPTAAQRSPLRDVIAHFLLAPHRNSSADDDCLIALPSPSPSPTCT